MSQNSKLNIQLAVVKKGMQVVVWRGLYFVQFRIVKPLDLCGFITATPGSTLTSTLLLALAFCTLCYELSHSSCTVFQRL